MQYAQSKVCWILVFEPINTLENELDLNVGPSACMSVQKEIERFCFQKLLIFMQNFILLQHVLLLLERLVKNV